MSRPSERCGWNNRDDPASSYAVEVVVADASSFDGGPLSREEVASSFDVTVDVDSDRSFRFLPPDPLVLAVAAASKAASPAEEEDVEPISSSPSFIVWGKSCYNFGWVAVRDGKDVLVSSFRILIPLYVP